MKIRKSKMKKFVLETIDFTSIFKGYRIPIPFFLLCIDNIITKITELCLVEITEMHYLQGFEDDCFRP